MEYAQIATQLVSPVSTAPTPPALPAQDHLVYSKINVYPAVGQAITVLAMCANSAICPVQLVPLSLPANLVHQGTSLPTEPVSVFAQ